MCISPIILKNDNIVRKYSTHKVPCGKCYECRMRRGAGWMFRLQQEERLHSSALFATLTYSDSNLPEYSSLRKADLQLFFKRLRKRHSEKIKYYACGEYGTRTKRPHYHAIIFGARRDLIQPSWQLGHTMVFDVQPAMMAYVCGYVNKPPSLGLSDYQEKEFSLMSKGLGAQYLTKETIRYHKENMASYCTLPGGVITAMPRYYRDKIFDSVEKDTLNEMAELEHEKKLYRAVSTVGWDDYSFNKHESIKSKIKKQEYLLTQKRNRL